MRRVGIVLLWSAFIAVLVALALNDLTTNPILDEAQWPEAGMSAAYNHFAKTALIVGPLYALVLGVVFSVVYAIGSLLGLFAGAMQFFAWSFCHQGFFYLVARGLTVAIVLGGVVLLARALAEEVGGLAASALAIGFVFTVPSLAWMAFATPHGALIGYAGALIFVLVRAGRGSPWWWAVSGAIVAAAFASMTIGIGLGLLPFLTALLSGRPRHAGLVLAGFAVGMVVAGYPILLHPGGYWEENIQYQLHRNILSNEGGDGRLVQVWLTQAPTLWLAALAGVLWGRFRGPLRIAPAAFATALAYILVLALATRTRQVKYSLAVLPCLAWCAAGLVRAVEERSPRAAAALVLAIVLVPGVQTLGYLARRLEYPDVKAVAALRMMETIPPGKSVLVDFLWGPRLQNRHLLLARYGERGAEFDRLPAFRDYVDRCLPPEQNRWRVVVYPHDLPHPDRAALRRQGIDFVVVSERTMNGVDGSSPWRPMIEAGVLQPTASVASPGAGRDETIWFYRTAPPP
jgi:hypothetical protein